MNASTSLASRLPLAIRDTALTVAGLHANDSLESDLPAFRATCEEQIDRLQQELGDAGYPEQVVNDAVYAQCALLDESVLRCLKGAARDTWQHKPLQVSRFNSHDAGEELIRRMHTQAQAAQPEPLLLSIFHTVLLMGFHGKYAASDGAANRQGLIRMLASRLDGDAAGENAANPILVIGTGSRRRWRLHVSPLAWVCLATLAATLLYGCLHYWLSRSIDALTQR